MRRLLSLGAAILVMGTAAVVALPQAALAAEPPVYTGTFSSTAVDGYDPVAYFVAGKPVKGDKKFKTEWNGAEWHFANAENLASFKADPAKYAPQYGGYCAWAVSQGYTASADPDAWKIVDGKLYLNYNQEIQERWQKETASLIAKADQNWPTVLTK